MKSSDYLRAENWHGSFYELSLQLGPPGDNERAITALRAMWDLPELLGPWRTREAFGTAPVVPELDNECLTHYGVLSLSNQVRVGCMSFLIRCDDADWLDLSIPTGMLERVFHVRYPLDAQTSSWLREIDDLFASVGDRVYRQVPFLLGCLGEESSGCRKASELSSSDCVRGGFLVPTVLYEKLTPLVPATSGTRSLVYLPYEGPHITFGA